MTTTDTTSGTAAVTQVHHYYDLVDSGDVAGLVGLFTPDAVYHRPGYPPMRGHSDMTAFYDGARVIQEGRHTVSKVVTSGSDVAVHGIFVGVLRDGKPVELRFSDFFEVVPDGRFSRRDTFFFAPLV